MNHEHRMTVLRWSILLAGRAFALFATIALLTASANAYYFRVTGTICQPYYPSDSHVYVASDAYNYVLNTSTTVASDFVCAFVDNPDIGHANSGAAKIDVVSVKVSDGDATSGQRVAARVCAWNASAGTSASCATDTEYSPASPATGRVTLTLSTTGELNSLGTAGETAYLWINLPKSSWISTIYFEAS